MDEQAVRARAQAMCDALAAGDIDRATGDFSPELRRNLGEVLALMPLPANEVEIESVEHGGSGYKMGIPVGRQGDEVVIPTRWKDPDGQPRAPEGNQLSPAPAPP